MAYQRTEEDRKLVEQMAACGIPQQSIAMVIGGGIAEKTLRKHFRRELDTSSTIANAKVAGTLFNKAINGDTTSAIFWLKTRAGWREKAEVVHSLDEATSLLAAIGQDPRNTIRQIEAPVLEHEAVKDDRS